MSEFKGTKGNWSVYKPNHIGCENVNIGDNTGFDGYVELWHHHYDTKEEAKANALLISKAPEMLEMLQNITEYSPYEIKQLIKQATEI